MPRSLTRRAFLQGAAAALAAGPACASEAAVFPIVDTHQHLWDLGKFRLPWLEGQPKLARNFVMSDYLAATAVVGQGAGPPRGRVVAAVYMEVDVAPEQQQAEADFVISLCKAGNTPTKAGVVSGRPASDGFAAYVRPFRDSPYIKGIRQVLHGPGTPPGYCLDPKFIAGIRLLGELGLSYDLCLRSAELGDAVKLIDACPDTRFILDHCGNADVKARERTQWKRDMAEIAKRPRVMCKVSGIIASAPPGRWQPDDLAPILHHTLDVFGPDRVMFGGDWPVCTLAATYAQWVDALWTIVKERPAAEQQKLFADNAVAFYRLS